MKNHLLWKRVLGANPLQNDERKVIQQLLTGCYKSADFSKKKAPGTLFSVRLNDENRLLLTEIIHEGKPCLLIHE